MARFTIVALLIATMAVAAMAGPSLRAAGTGPTAATFGKFFFGGLWYTKKFGWYCAYDPVSGTCTYDPNYVWWAPSRPVLTPIWAGGFPGPAATPESALAICTTQTGRGLVAGGGCSCTNAGPPIAPSAIGVNKPVQITGTALAPIVNDCGNQQIPAAACNGWQCVCVAAGDTATAWAYCV